MKQLADFLEALPLTAVEPCAYFHERPSRMRAFRCPEGLPETAFAMLLNRGYRRCGDAYYRPDCPDCRACIPYRVPLDKLRISRSQRRVLRRNSTVTFQLSEPRSTLEKTRLYRRYFAARHEDGSGRAEYDPVAAMEYQMYTSPPATREFEMRDPDGALMAFGIIDVANAFASAVYTVFDPDASRCSPGTLAILRSLQWADEAGLAYFHLGYYIAAHRKMVYKARFGPGEWLNWDTLTWESGDQLHRGT